MSGEGIFLSTGTLSDGTGGFGAALRRFITAGIPNSDFHDTPPAANSDVDDGINALPFWSYQRGSGTGVSLRSVADPASASGRVLRFSMASGAAGDSGYISQYIGINGSRGQSYAYCVKGTLLTPSISNAFRVTVAATYVDVNGVNLLGGAMTISALFSAIVGPVDLFPLPSHGAPANAYSLLVQVQLDRNGAAITDSGYIDLTEVRAYTAADELFITDQVTTANEPAAIYKSNGILYIQAAATATTLSRLLLSSSQSTFEKRIAFTPVAQTISAATDTIISTAKYIDLTVSGGPFTLTSAPTIADGVNGMEIVLTQVAGANAVTIQDQGTLANSNLRLSTATYALSTRDSITLRYSSAIGDWVEVARTNVI